MLASIVVVVTSCQSESKNEKTYVDTAGPASGPGLDSGERSMDTTTIDSTKVSSSQERYPNQ